MFFVIFQPVCRWILPVDWTELAHGRHSWDSEQGGQGGLFALCPLRSGWGASTVSLSLSLSLCSSRSGIFNTITGTGVGVGDSAGAQTENQRPAGFSASAPRLPQLRWGVTQPVSDVSQLRADALGTAMRPDIKNAH